jgi:hypothetical protein
MPRPYTGAFTCLIARSIREICVARDGIQKPVGIRKVTGGKRITEDMSMMSIINWCGRDFECCRVKVLSKSNLSGSETLKVLKTFRV